MNTLSMPLAAAAPHAAPPPVLPRRLLVAIAGFWLFTWAFLSLVITSGRGSDAGPPWPALLNNAVLLLPWVLFSLVLLQWLERHRATLSRPRVLVGALLVCTFSFYLPFVLYEVALDLWHAGRPWSGYFAMLGRWPLAAWFTDYVLFVGCFASLYAVAAFRESLHVERQRQRVDSENLSLRLELEHQRLAALQAQLEPHFLFNALNAISGLVREEDKRGALTGLARLSELLRYALAATGREKSTLGEELDFVRDYLSLQVMRHGPRLSLHVEGDSSELRACECPPLLLQPLVENALRHDLECHAGASDIRLHFEWHADEVLIVLSNPVRSGLPPNPGLGLGLRNTRDRIALLYRGRASLDTRTSEGRFEVRLQLPPQIEA